MLELIPLTPTLFPAVATCLQAQAERSRTLDPLLPASRSKEAYEAILAHHLSSGTPGWVVCDPNGNVKGYSAPGLWILSPRSLLHAFITAKNGIARSLCLPDPSDPDAAHVLRKLLSSLSVWWKHQQSTGDLIRWPTCEQWVEPILATEGFVLDSVCAIAPALPLFAFRPTPASLLLREARPADEERLVELLREELEYHEAVVPFARCCPQVLSSFQGKLARLWAGEHLKQGAHHVLVAEQGKQVVAMTEISLLDLALWDEPGLTPPGRYLCIDNLSVTSDYRGQGIGRLLVQACYAQGSPLSVSGLLLYYNLDNRVAASFWTRLGFHPLWMTYQRRLGAALEQKEEKHGTL